MSPPTVFGPYRLEERLAAGGMADIHRATLSGPAGFKKTVVIKKIAVSMEADKRFRKMFLHEGRLMASLNHRNVLSVYEMGEIDQQLFLCLQWIDGCNLQQLIEVQARTENPCDPILAAWIARELCHGLVYIHGLRDHQGQALAIVHRDVNPQNVLLSRHGDVKLGDFGISRSTANQDATAETTLMGKVRYLAPEQVKRELVGPATDVYAVGLILYELLTRRPYLDGLIHDEVLHQAAHPRWQAMKTPGVPAALAAGVQKALAENPLHRHADAAAWADALTQVIETAPGPSRRGQLAQLVQKVQACAPADSGRQDTAPTNKNHTVMMPDRSTRPRSGASKWLKIAAGLAVLLLAIVGLMLYRSPARLAPPLIKQTPPVAASPAVLREVMEAIEARPPKPEPKPKYSRRIRPRRVKKRALPKTDPAPVPVAKPIEPVEAEISYQTVKRKLERLQRTLRQKGMESRFQMERKQILNHLLNDRYRLADQAINQVFYQIEAK